MVGGRWGGAAGLPPLGGQRRHNSKNLSFGLSAPKRIPNVAFRPLQMTRRSRVRALVALAAVSACAACCGASLPLLQSLDTGDKNHPPEIGSVKAHV